MAATQIVELTQSNLYVHKFRGFLQISRSGEYVGRVSLDDVLALVVANPANTISLRLMDYLVNNNVPVVLAGKNYMPSSMVLPMSGYSHQYRVMHAQIKMSAPRKKRAWQAIVKSKIANQAQVLHLSTGLDRRLPHLVTRVRSGDPSNCEGQAARIYFPALFGPAFIRDRDASGINARLNYSYAIVRAAVARGMSAAGLHPTIGVHHKHPYNPLNLLEDLVEPFRPWADLLVWRSLKSNSDLDSELTPEVKQVLSRVLKQLIAIDGSYSPLPIAAVRFCRLFADYCAGIGSRLPVPALQDPYGQANGT